MLGVGAATTACQDTETTEVTGEGLGAARAAPPRVMGVAEVDTI